MGTPLDAVLPSPRARVDVRALRPLGSWGMLAAKLGRRRGRGWDIRWHRLIGRDSFAWVSGGVVLAAAVLATETRRARAGEAAPGTVEVLGVVGTPPITWPRSAWSS
jgi:hypothetical protein